jgi:ABC-type uncharacterized transport system permease subunit
MDFKLNGWIRFQRFSLFWSSSQFKKKSNVAKASILAVVFGILLGILIICANGYDGFSFFINIFENAFDSSISNGSETLFDQTIMYFSSYFLIGLGISLGFKLGLFNMGGSGQAVLGMAFATHLLCTTDKTFSPAYAIVVVFIFALSGVLVSLIAGVLKAYLNVHEVVTSIMLNWTIWYFFKWLDSSTFTYTGTPGTPDFKSDPQNYAQWFTIGGNPIGFGLILVVLAIAIVWIVTTFTTAGYKFKVVGQQKEAAKYAGINAKLYIISTMAIQGVLIGLGSLIYYFQIAGKIEIKNDTVPTIGFDALTIPLVAFNNVFGMIPIALLWASIKSGMDGAIFSFQGLQRETGSLMFGLVIYGAAIYVLFLKLDPWKWIRTWISMSWDWEAKIKIREIKNKIKLLKLRKKFYKYDPQFLEQEEKVNALDEAAKAAKGTPNAEVAYHAYVKEKKLLQFNLKSQRKSYIMFIKQLHRDIRAIHSDSLKVFAENTRGAIYASYFNANKLSMFELLDKITRRKIDRNDEITVSKSHLNELKNSLSETNKADKKYLEIKASLEKEKDSFKTKSNEIVNKYTSLFKNDIIGNNELVKSRKEQYKNNSSTINKLRKEIKSDIRKTKKESSGEFRQLIKQEREEQKNILSKNNAKLKEFKSSSLTKKDLYEKIWNLQNEWVSELEKSFKDVSKTKLFKGMLASRQREMEVVKKYGCN